MDRKSEKKKDKKNRKRIRSSSSSKRTKNSIGSPSRREVRRGGAKARKWKDSTSPTKSSKSSLPPPASSSSVDGQGLTHNAVRSLTRGESEMDKENGPVVVRLRLEEEEEATTTTAIDEIHYNGVDEEKTVVIATMTDGTHFCKVLILNKLNVLAPYQMSRGFDDLILSIQGYVTTDGSNTKYQLQPIISITNFKIIKTVSRNDGFQFGDKVIFSPSNSTTTSSSSSQQHHHPPRFHTGTIGTFMDQRAPFLTTDELAGSTLVSETFFDQDAPPLTASGDDTKIQPSPNQKAHLQNMETVGNFLARHVAMVTLQSSASKTTTMMTSTSTTTMPFSDADATADSSSPQQPLSESSTPRSPIKSKPLTEHAVQNYNDALREFTTSQLDRQLASLGTNAGRETADRATLICERHNSALEMAMKLDDSKPLSPTLLQQLHKELLRDLHPDAGKFRTKMVRAGQTRFAPPDKIESELTLLCNAINSLEQRLDLSNATHAVLFASIAMYGVVDVHPFLDGNGRLSRIIANWALKKVPFPINLFATPAQRSEYVLNIEKTRHFLSLTRTHGQVSRDEIMESLKTTGVFSSLIRLVMDRVARSVAECNRVFEEKSYLAAEAAEDRAARRARERSAQGTCIICFDEKPNIATLCCGKAVHLNCIAEWLSNNNTCPVCRGEIPSINRRVLHATTNNDNQNTDTTDSSEDEELASDSSDSDAIIVRRVGDRVVADLLSSLGHNASSLSGQDEDDDDRDSDGHEIDYDDIEDHTTTMSDDDDDDESPDEVQNGRPTDESGETTMFMNLERSSASSSDGAGSENGNNVQQRPDSNDTTQDEGDETEIDGEAAVEDTTTFDESTTIDENATDETTTQDAQAPPVAAPRPAIHHCDALYCRNRRAADCVNSLCGRCCVLAGRLACPRHNANA